MTRFLILCTGSLFLLSFFYRCNSTQKTAQNPAEFRVLESYQSNVIRGAGSTKGMKISIKALTLSEQTLDSITYERRTKKLETIKIIKDTTWAEVIFYQDPLANNVVYNDGYKPEIEFSENNCTLHYTEGKKTKNLPISDMEMKTDNTLWK